MRALIGIGLTALVAVSAPKEAPALYPSVGIITEVDMESDTVYWTDGPNVWTFYGAEDWMVGDGIVAIMSDEGTESLKDDRMVGSPRYWNPDYLGFGD